MATPVAIEVKAGEPVQAPDARNTVTVEAEVASAGAVHVRVT
jgi:hypothetical protein